MEKKNKEDNYTLHKLQMDIPIPISNFFRTPYIRIKDAVDRFQFQYTTKIRNPTQLETSR